MSLVRFTLTDPERSVNTFLFFLFVSNGCEWGRGAAIPAPSSGEAGGQAAGELPQLLPRERRVRTSAARCCTRRPLLSPSPHLFPLRSWAASRWSRLHQACCRRRSSGSYRCAPLRPRATSQTPSGSRLGALAGGRGHDRLKFSRRRGLTAPFRARCVFPHSLRRLSR
jgi:hypothetical protein